MQAASRIVSLPESQPLPDPVREQLVFAFRRRARQQELSLLVTQRYQAWTFLFVSWCHETPPHQIGPHRIGAFRDVLRACPEMGDEEVHEAMDALTFLFGSVEEAESLLASVNAHSEASSEETESGKGESAANASIQTLQIGWKQGKPTGDNSDQIDSSSAGSASTPDTETSSKEGASTAEACIARFQTQIETLHASDARSGSSAERETGRKAGPFP